jgi:hypothetical protein
MRALTTITASLWLGVQATASAAYLLLLGPGELRFQAAAPPPTPPATVATTVLPSPPPPPEPAPPPAPLPTDGTNAVAPPAPAATNTAPAASVTVVASSPLTADDLAALGLTNRNFSVGGAVDPARITPQMLMYYFQQAFSGTNAPPSAVALPLFFMPPVPLARPSSRATYVVTP